MAGPKAAGEAPEVGIGMLGYAFMGKAHSQRVQEDPVHDVPARRHPEADRRLRAGRGGGGRRGPALRLRGILHRLAEDAGGPAIQLFDNGGPNDTHAEPCIEAAKAGKHVFCEKPLARTAEEARTMRDAVLKAGVKHQAAFNYRFVPAVRQAYELIRSGQAGQALPLPRLLPAGMDHAALQHAHDLAHGQEARPAAAPWGTSARTSSTWPGSSWER